MKMSIIIEGRTEKAFVNTILSLSCGQTID
jgi:hypothetical protein